jgi:pseudaminic acid synthase
MQLTEIEIAGRKIGHKHAPYVIAELSANHNGDLQTALDTISSAKNCGADAIKLQTYTPDSMTIESKSIDFVIEGGLWDGYRLYDLYKEAHTPLEWHQTLFEHARKIGITCFSTPFDEDTVDFLEKFDVPAYKIASFEATDLQLIRHAASKGKPLIMSTGMASLSEISEMVEAAKEGGCREIILLHCISSYPAPVHEANLSTIRDMQSRFGVQVGLSDHTLSNITSITACALGATMIEKHFILDKSQKGPDSDFSISPEELSLLCQDTKEAWSSLGEAGYGLRPAETSNLKFRRSIYFVEDIKKGETIEKRHIRRIRPGFGLAPKYEDLLLGKAVTEDIVAGTATSFDLVAGLARHV